MAFSTKNVYTDPNFALIPTGASVATAAASIGTVEPGMPLRGIEATIAASTSVDTTQAAGFDALLDTDLVAFIDNLITSTDAGGGLGKSVASDTVSYNAFVTKIELEDPKDIFLNAATRNFVVTFDLSFSVTA